MIDDLDVTSVFGEPSVEGETTVIPVADVMYGYGYGYGGSAEGEGGGGGGGGGKATPRGYIEVTSDGVSYKATENETLIALAGILTGVWSIFWLAITVMTVAKAVAKVRTAEVTQE
ncbi:MAG: hypothetical protein GY759_00530 [Chloroflexi bacterium]|nr:hypothetical protein [Chloroflexota bacterium]